MTELIKLVGDSPFTAFYACPLAFLFGAVHTFLPGHGKTIVCGYCVGRKRHIGKILFVTGVAVVTHLLSSALLGVIAMTTSQVLVRNVILYKIQLGAACLLILLGLGMLISEARKVFGKRHVHHHHPHTEDAHLHSHSHEHPHDHEHSHGRLDALLKELMVEQNAPFHRYIQLFWLGLAAGLIPCLEPFTLMLFAIALDRIALGFGLLISFGLGVYLTMAGFGIMVTSEKLSAAQNSQSRFFKNAAKAAVIFKAAYPLIILALGSAWLFLALKGPA